MAWHRTRAIVRRLLDPSNIILIVTIVAAGGAAYFGVAGGGVQVMFIAILAVLGALVVGIFLHNLTVAQTINDINKRIQYLQSARHDVEFQMGRANIPSLRDRVSGARDILLTGRTLSLAIRDPELYISLLKKGVRVRLLFTNPANRALVDVVRPSLDLKHALDPDLETTTSVLKQIAKRIPKSSRMSSLLEVRVLDSPMTQNIAVISGASLINNVYSEVLSHNTAPADRLAVLVYEKENANWYRYLSDQATKQWDDGVKYDLEFADDEAS